MDDDVVFVRVINGNEKAVTGRFNGRDFHFEPDKPADVPEIVARHVFGFGIEDKLPALSRLGWARSSDELDSGMQKLGKVVFEEPPELVEAPTPKGARRRKGSDETGAAGPPVNAGGTEGGSFKAPPNGPRIGQRSEDDF